MPHRTVFQVGKDHAHPFTMFVGGFVIGTLVTGAVAWAWDMAEEADQEPQNAANLQNADSATAAPTISPSPSPRASF